MTAVRAVLSCLTTLSVVAAGTVPLGAQVTTHPRDMAMPAPANPRPEPADLRLTLDDGLVAYVARDGSAPLVTFTVFVGAGRVDGADGAADALGAAMRSGGPAGGNPDAFRRRLDAMAADYAVLVGAEQIEIRLDVPAEDAIDALGLLSALVLDGPDLGGAGMASGAGATDPSSGASGESGPVLYEGSLESATALLRDRLLDGTRYGPIGGDGAPPSVDDVRDFHRRFFVSRNMALGVAGDFERMAMDAALRRAFADVRNGNRHTRRDTPAPGIPTERTLYLYPADKLQGWLVLGTVLPVVPRDDEAALDVMNYILGGGHFDTRLFQEARDKRGLTNDDSGFLEPNRDGPGVYTFRTYGRPEAVRLLLELTLREAERMRESAVSDEELFVARGALADGVFAARYRDGWSTVRSFAEEWVASGNHDGSATYARRIRSVTDEDVRRVARRYLHPGGWTGVLVGPLAAIEAAPPLEGERALQDYGRVITLTVRPTVRPSG